MSLGVFSEGVSESECVSGLTKREEAGGEEEEAEASNEYQEPNLRILESSCCRRSRWGALGGPPRRQNNRTH